MLFSWFVLIVSEYEIDCLLSQFSEFESITQRFIIHIESNDNYPLLLLCTTGICSHETPKS